MRFAGGMQVGQQVPFKGLPKEGHTLDALASRHVSNALSTDKRDCVSKQVHRAAL